MGLGNTNRCNAMVESHGKDWVVGNWVDNLQSRFGWLRVWEHAAFLIDLKMCCLILSCSLWEVRPTIPTVTMARQLVNYCTLLCWKAGSTVHLSCLQDTDLWWYKQNMVPKRQSMFWLRFLFVFRILLKWGQCTVNTSRLDIFRGQIIPRALNCWIFLDVEVSITCSG